MKDHSLMIGVATLILVIGIAVFAGVDRDTYRRNELVNMLIRAKLTDSTIAELVKLPIYERSETFSDSQFICVSRGGRVAIKVTVCEFKTLYDYTGDKK